MLHHEHLSALHIGDGAEQTQECLLLWVELSYFGAAELLDDVIGAWHLDHFTFIIDESEVPDTEEDEENEEEEEEEDDNDLFSVFLSQSLYRLLSNNFTLRGAKFKF